VAKDGHVLKTRAAVPARRITASFGAFAVIEMPAGTLLRSQTRQGDVISVVESP
jgi:hypothetical protein